MNRALPVSVAFNLVMAVLLLLCWRSCRPLPCPDGVVVKQWSDTVHVNEATAKPDMSESVPVVRSIKPTSNTTHPNPSQEGKSKVSPFPVSVSAEGAGYCFSGTSAQLPPSPLKGGQEDVSGNCSDLVQYEDTFYKADEYRAVLMEMVNNNRIISRKIAWQNLQPVITEHVEKTVPLKERVRIYLGLSVGFEASYAHKKVSNFNVGPDVFLTAPNGMLFGYGFDAKNNGHRVTFAYKIKLKK